VTTPPSPRRRRRRKGPRIAAIGPGLVITGRKAPPGLSPDDPGLAHNHRRAER